MTVHTPLTIPAAAGAPLAGLARSAPFLSAGDVAAAMLRSDVPAAVKYLQNLKLLKATIEACQLLATEISGASEVIGLGPSFISDMPDMLTDVMGDCRLTLEIQRLSDAIDIKEGD